MITDEQVRAAILGYLSVGPVPTHLPNAHRMRAALEDAERAGEKPTRDEAIEELQYADYRHGSETGFRSSKAIPHFIDALVARGWLEVRGV